MIQMKKMAAAVALAAASVGGAQATALGNGDFAFTALNTNTTVGGWSFVSFLDIAAGTTIYFTDTNVLQTTPTTGVFSTTAETFWSWTATSAVAAGTSVAVYGNGTVGANTTSTGTVANANAGAFNISGSGDILYAFQAASFATNYQAADITFLGAISNRTTPYATSDNPLVATGLSGIQVRQFRIDNATATRYTEFTPQTTTTDTPYLDLATLKSELANTANWTTVAASNSIVVKSDVLAVPEASTYAMLLAGLGMIGLMARRRSV